MWRDQQARLVERVSGSGGEIQLQKRGAHYEMIYNGVFLMATYNGASERAAVKRALSKLVPRRGAVGLHILMGGLGVGYSLQEALGRPQVARVVVAEIEGAVIAWNEQYLRAFNGGALDDPRVTLLHRDFFVVLQEARSDVYDLVMVDTDNGSTWLSRAENEAIYSQQGLQLIHRCLAPGGVAGFWSSRQEPEFEATLHGFFSRVRYESVLEETGQEGGFYLMEKWMPK